jgi:hypothetical protein
VDDVGLLGPLQPEQKIFRLDISVDQTALVHTLDPAPNVIKLFTAVIYDF